MKIGEYILNYRNEHGLSQRDFAKLSGVSNSLISMLEKDENPKTKKPIDLSIIYYRKIALATGTDVNGLFEILGPDAPVLINDPPKMSLSNPSFPFDPELVKSLETSIRESETKRQIRERQHQNVLKLQKIFESLSDEGQEYLLQQADIAKKMFGGK